MGLYYIYAHDKLVEGGVSPKVHYIGTVFAASPDAALKKAKHNRDWQAVYKGFRLEHSTDLRRNPRHATTTGIRAQVRRLPSGEVQIKVPLKRGENPMAKARELAKALGRKVVSVARAGAKKANPAHQGWNVYLRGKWVNKVFTITGMTANEVKRSLVDHDGYDPGITVRKERKRKQ